MKSIFLIIAKNPGSSIALLIALWIGALGLATRLRIELDPVSLMPKGSVSAAAFEAYQSRFGGANTVFVIFDTPEPRVAGYRVLLSEAASRFAREIESTPEVSAARSGITEADEFNYLRAVIGRAPLLIRGPSALKKVRCRLDPEAIANRAQELKALAQLPAYAWSVQVAKFDPLGFSQDLEGIGDFGSLIDIDPMTGSFLSQDGNSSLVILQPTTSELDPDAGRRLSEAISNSATKVSDEVGLDVQVAATGGPLFAYYDEQAIRSDLEKTLPWTVVACGVLMIAVFGNLRLPLAGICGLLFGLTLLAAFLVLTVGTLSAIAISFSSILVGLGIDAAIHGSVAYRRWQYSGRQPEAALELVLSQTGAPIAAAAATTIAAFSVLLFSSLPPIRELGFVVVFGMILVLFATGALGSSLAVKFAARYRPPGFLWNAMGWVVDVTLTASQAHPARILVLALVVSGAAALGIPRLHVQANFQGLRPSAHPAVEGERIFNERFGGGTNNAHVLVSGSSFQEALDRARLVQAVVKSSSNSMTLLPRVSLLASPNEIASRLQILQKLDFKAALDTLESEMRRVGLKSSFFSPGLKALDSFAEGQDPFNASLMSLEFLDADSSGEVWIALTLLPGGSPGSSEQVSIATDAIEDSVPGALVASAERLGNDLRSRAILEFQELFVPCLGLIALVVALFMRLSAKNTLLALAPVALGIFWTLGFWGLCGATLDIVGLAVLPALVGIGIDDGLHVMHSARSGGSVAVAASTKDSGTALILTTLTTAAGFGTLAFSHLPSLRAAAVLVPTGVVCSLLATLTVLPAASVLIKGKEDVPRGC